MLQWFINRYANHWYRDFEADEDGNVSGTLYFELSFMRDFLNVSKSAGSWHIWVGRAGLHLFWPLWESELDWSSRSWRTQP